MNQLAGCIKALLLIGGIFSFLIVAQLIVALLFSIINSNNFQDIKKHIKIYIAGCVILPLSLIMFNIHKIEHPYSLELNKVVSIMQISKSNMFVKQGRSGNDIAKYQILTTAGVYKEYLAENVRVTLLADTNPVINVYEKTYTSFWGKFCNYNFEGMSKHTYEVVEISLPTQSVEGYVNINF